MGLIEPFPSFNPASVSETPRAMSGLVLVFELFLDLFPLSLYIFLFII